MNSPFLELHPAPAAPGDNAGGVQQLGQQLDGRPLGASAGTPVAAQPVFGQGEVAVAPAMCVCVLLACVVQCVLQQGLDARLGRGCRDVEPVHRMCAPGPDLAGPHTHAVSSMSSHPKLPAPRSDAHVRTDMCAGPTSICGASFPGHGSPSLWRPSGGGATVASRLGSLGQAGRAAPAHNEQVMQLLT